MGRRPASPASTDATGADAVPQLPSIALHKLPPQLRLLVRVMGEASAYRLVELRGGTPITVPQSLHSPAGVALAELLGAAAAARLIDGLVGQTLQLPKNDSVLRQLRHQRVLELRGQGMRLAAVALATGYTVRQVINICNRNGVIVEAGEEAPAPQHDLWPELLDAQPPAPPAAHNPFGLQSRPADGTGA